MNLSRSLIMVSILFLLALNDQLAPPSILASVTKESPKEKVQKWLKYLSDENEEIRDKAALELGLLGDPDAVEPLIKQLSAPKAWTRRTVVLSLGRLKDKRAFGPIEKMLKDTDLEVRTEALTALVAIDREAALPYLKVALEDTSFEMRGRAVFELWHCPEPVARGFLLKMLDDREPLVREESIHRLHLLKSTASAKRIAKKLYADQDEDVRNEAASVLLQLSPQTRQMAIEALKHPDMSVRLAVTHNLRYTSYLTDRKDIDNAKFLLLEMLKDGSPEVRVAALESLHEIHGGFDPAHWYPAFRGSLLSKEADTERLRVDEYTIAAMLGLLKDEHPHVRASAAQGLGALREKGAVKPLIHLLGVGDPVVRLTAAHALGKLGDKRALGPLEELGQREAGFGAKLTIAMARAALLQTFEQSWVPVPDLRFPVEIGVHQTVEAPAGEDRRISVYLRPEDFNEARIETLCRYFSAEFSVPEQMSISIETERTRIEQRRSDRGPVCVARSYTVEEEVELARRAYEPNRYLFGYYMRDRNNEAVYFALPENPAKQRVIVFKGKNPWP